MSVIFFVTHDIGVAIEICVAVMYAQALQPPRPGSAQRSIWEAPTICLG